MLPAGGRCNTRRGVGGSMGGRILGGKCVLDLKVWTSVIDFRPNRIQHSHPSLSPFGMFRTRPETVNRANAMQPSRANAEKESLRRRALEVSD